MLNIFNKKLKRLCSKLGWPVRARRRPKPKIVVKKLGKSSSRTRSSDAVIHPTHNPKPVRFATFNAALFSMAPVVPTKPSLDFEHDLVNNNNNNNNNNNENYNGLLSKSMNFDRPKSILKQSPLHPANGNLTKQQKFARSRLRVSINLPDNEISLKKSGQLNVSFFDEDHERNLKGKAPVTVRSSSMHGLELRSGRTIVEVLRELDADVLALQDVKAEEEKNMEPLSHLAEALGMKYVFAESWAPEYGNAILSKWPVKRWKAQKIFDESDYRNVLKATIDVPHVGEMNFFCTHLDHLDENWRMKQIDAIIQSTQVPHILAGGLNSLDETDYSQERWTDIVKYYEEMGKPTPKVEVMKYLKSKQYTDAKDFAGECESVVMIAKGQSVQGTCKYGTRVDYLLASPNAPYKFVPGSYSVVSSKGTSDHHIVKVDVIKVCGSPSEEQYSSRKPSQQHGRRTVKIAHSSSPSKGIWKLHS